MGEESPSLRRLQEPTEPFTTSILRAQFVAYCATAEMCARFSRELRSEICVDDTGEEKICSSGPEQIKTAFNTFREDEDAMKAQFMEALNEASCEDLRPGDDTCEDLPRSVTVLGVTMSKPATISHSVVTAPEKS